MPDTNPDRTKRSRRKGRGARAAKASEPKHNTKICIFYLQPSGCPYGDRCFFAHGEHQLRMTEDPDSTTPGSTPETNERFKTRMCKHWASSMGTHCPHGVRCTFAHGQVELEKYTSAAQERRAMNGPSPESGTPKTTLVLDAPRPETTEGGSFDSPVGTTSSVSVETESSLAVPSADLHTDSPGVLLDSSVSVATASATAAKLQPAAGATSEEGANPNPGSEHDRITAPVSTSVYSHTSTDSVEATVTLTREAHHPVEPSSRHGGADTTGSSIPPSHFPHSHHAYHHAPRAIGGSSLEGDPSSGGEGGGGIMGAGPVQSRAAPVSRSFPLEAQAQHASGPPSGSFAAELPHYSAVPSHGPGGGLATVDPRFMYQPSGHVLPAGVHPMRPPIPYPGSYPTPPSAGPPTLHSGYPTLHTSPFTRRRHHDEPHRSLAMHGVGGDYPGHAPHHHTGPHPPGPPAATTYPVPQGARYPGPGGGGHDPQGYGHSRMTTMLPSGVHTGSTESTAYAKSGSHPTSTMPGLRYPHGHGYDRSTHGLGLPGTSSAGGPEYRPSSSRAPLSSGSFASHHDSHDSHDPSLLESSESMGLGPTGLGPTDLGWKRGPDSTAPSHMIAVSSMASATHAAQSSALDPATPWHTSKPHTSLHTKYGASTTRTSSVGQFGPKDFGTSGFGSTSTGFGPTSTGFGSGALGSTDLGSTSLGSTSFGSSDLGPTNLGPAVFHHDDARSGPMTGLQPGGPAIIDTKKSPSLYGREDAMDRFARMHLSSDSGRLDHRANASGSSAVSTHGAFSVPITTHSTGVSGAPMAATWAAPTGPLSMAVSGATLSTTSSSLDRA